MMQGPPAVVEEPFVHQSGEHAVRPARRGTDRGRQEGDGGRRHQRDHHLAQPDRDRQLVRDAEERRPAPNAVIAHGQRKQEREARRDDDAVGADEPEDSFQVADPRLLEIQRRLAE